MQLTIGGNAKIHNNTATNVISFRKEATVKENAQIFNNISNVSNGCAGITALDQATLYIEDLVQIYGNKAMGATIAGVRLNQNAKMCMSGGEIFENTIYSSVDNGDIGSVGVRCETGSSIDLSASAAVYENKFVIISDSTYADLTPKKDTDGSDKIYASDIELRGVGSCCISGALTTLHSIGIAYSNRATNDDTVVVSGKENYQITNKDFSKLVFNGHIGNAQKTIYFDSASNTIKIGTARTVTFNPNEGIGEIHTQKVPSGHATVLNTNTFIRTGYTFAGWSTQQSGGETTYMDGASITISNDVTLYAQWTPNEYTITYELNGGTADADAPTQHTYGTETALVSPAREGYTFAGWFIDSGLSGNKLESLGATDYTDDITLYAKWTPNTYTISFSGGEGAEGATASVTATYDTPATLTANGFTKSGSNFAGWTKTQGGTVEYSDGAQVLNLTAEASGTVTLYAVWTDKQVLTPDTSVQTKTYNGAAQVFTLDGYTISYQQDGGSATPKDAGTYDVVISAAETDTTAAYQNTVYGGLVITPATLTITPNNKTAYVGDALPALGANDYTVTGLVGSDTLSTAPTLAYDGTPDMNTAGAYTIKASGASAGDNYAITYKPGTLTVSRRSGGGGGGSSSTSGVSGSGGSVSVNAGGGTVSNSQMTAAVNKASEGAAIDIKATGSTAVSLPVSGMEKAAANDNDVTVITRSGEVTLSAAAIEGLVDGASSNQSIRVSVTTATASAAGVDAGTPVFDVSVTVGSKAVHSFDGSLTITLTVSNLSKIENPYVMHILTDGTKQYFKPRVSGNQLTVSGVRDLSYFAVIPGSEVPQELPFTDVAEGFWAYEGISYAYENGLFAGTSETTFGPDVTMTREMLWTVLSRLSGAELDGENVFQQARQWAMTSGVSDGTNGGGAITREHMVTMLYSYAGHPAASGDLSGYADASAVSGYATDAMAWAVESGIISGTSATTLSPQGSATRAQVATILMRFIERADQ